MTLGCLGNLERASEYEVALDNTYQFLEAYRTNTLFGLEPPTEITDERSVEQLTRRRNLQRHIRDVRQAISDALSTAFPQGNPQHGLEELEHVLRSMAYPDEAGEQLSRDEVRRATVFFQELLRLLEAR